MIENNYNSKLKKISDEKFNRWKQEQEYIKKLISCKDQLSCPTIDDVRLVAGVDISFSSKFENGACAGLIIYDVQLRKIVYEDYEYVKLKEEYIPGFLAFRELGPTLELFRRLKESKPDLWPQVIMADGNGILHKR